ncbi:TetR/AcrR family transcriptional regulator [Actinoallomurus bryophytorum]|uniref:TetR family transcriptional regulator n=1 Tax=Actinoallomurus bryophytorum TaxID=1490222 RepID=A0A543CVD7_9ACTN|nr:TetR/AcrR family transcriptional regulator [Actinoallomurus bryophytorum]TQM01073.1 TetR family transcriptional regulator [Actinoallomurus bryophytorum]
MRTDEADGPRRMRADARDNRERVLRAARAAFAEDGPRASLNKIAQRAGVGAGTLYRHFPTLDALLVAIIGADVEALCERGRGLLDRPSPGEALTTWLRAVAVHATAMRGLVATRMAAQTADTKAADGTLAACHDAILATGNALLDRARRAGEANEETGIADLLTLVNAAAWASEQAPEDQHLLDRLLALVARGFR